MVLGVLALTCIACPPPSVQTTAGKIAYTADQVLSLDETRVAAGLGARWLSPLGPLRIEAGVPVVKKDHDHKSLILFSFGGPFQF